MDKKSILEIKEELDSVSIQLALLDDFIQTFSFCLLEGLSDTVAPAQLSALKADFLSRLKEQQYQSLNELLDTIPLATIERNRLRVFRNVEILKEQYGLL